MKIVGCHIHIPDGGYIEIEEGDIIVGNYVHGNFDPNRASSAIIEGTCEDVEIPKSLMGQVVIGQTKLLRG